jgi:hypothetical protein
VIILTTDTKRFFFVRLAGPSIVPGRIPVPHLLRLLNELSKMINRVGRVINSEVERMRKGRVQQSIKDLTALDLVEVTHGSPAVVLGLERSCRQEVMEGIDFGLEIIEKSIEGLGQIQTEIGGMPYGFDAGVLLACRDLGVVFEQGITEVTLTLNHRPRPVTARYTEEGFRRIQNRIQGPSLTIRTVEGRLLMADFKEHGTRCRIHPSIGDPIICLFNESQKEEVLENILQFVKVIGEAKEDPISGKITSILIHDIKRLEDREKERLDLVPQGTPIPIDFWKSMSLEELAQAQDAQPINDVSTLFGTWPGSPDDGFEEIIMGLRKQNMLMEGQ